MRKQIEHGIIEKVDSEPVVGKLAYLPHFAVIREDKETTKLRVVYNGSAKTKGPSPIYFAEHDQYGRDKIC